MCLLIYSGWRNIIKIADVKRERGYKNEADLDYRR